MYYRKPERRTIMKRNLTALLLCVALTAALLTGCGSSAPAKSDTPPASAPESTPSETPKTDFPTKYLDFTIGFAAGTGADTNGRLICSLAEQVLGQSIAVTNKDGAGGALAYSFVAAAKPDGYTIAYNSNSQSIAHYNGNMPESYEDFEQVCRLTLEDNVVAVAAGSPWQTFEDLVAAVQAEPGRYICSNGGIGGFNHLAAVALESALGTTFQHIPLGGGDQITSMQSGEVDFGVASYANYAPYVDSGDVRILVSLGEESPSSAPEIPTAVSKGYDVVMSMYRGVSVPKGTPKEVIDILADAFKQAAESDEYKEFAEKNNMVISYMGPDEFPGYVAEDDVRIQAIMEDIGLIK